jgi:transposase, IS5 family
MGVWPNQKVSLVGGAVGSTKPAAAMRARTIGVIKRVFGFAKVRYRGLKKNAHRLIVAGALANLFIARRHLLRCDVA